MDARYKNFQLERKRHCATAEYLWRMTVVMDINRYAILIAIKKDWILELDKNFIDLFGFEKNIFKE